MQSVYTAAVVGGGAGGKLSLAALASSERFQPLAAADLSADVRAELESQLAPAHFLPDLSNHGHARNLTRKLIERGFADEQIAQILYGNWMRVFEQVLKG